MRTLKKHSSSSRDKIRFDRFYCTRRPLNHVIQVHCSKQSLETIKNIICSDVTTFHYVIIVGLQNRSGNLNIVSSYQISHSKLFLPHTLRNTARKNIFIRPCMCMMCKVIHMFNAIYLLFSIPLKNSLQNEFLPDITHWSPTLKSAFNLYNCFSASTAFRSYKLNICNYTNNLFCVQVRTKQLDILWRIRQRSLKHMHWVAYNFPKILYIWRHRANAQTNYCVCSEIQE